MMYYQSVSHDIESDQNLSVMNIIKGVLLIFACAQISIPIQPVPITLQTVAVMFIALCYNRKTALATIISYLAAGSIGLPVFASFKSGLEVLIGPRGGYLVGYVLAVMMMSTLKEYFSSQSFWGILTNCIMGTAIIFVCGIAFLNVYYGFEQSIKVGLLPFIIPGIIKSVLLAVLLKIRGPLRNKM